MAHRRTVVVTFDLPDEVMDVVTDHNGGNEPTYAVLAGWLNGLANEWAASHSECTGAECPSLQEAIAWKR